MPQSEGDALRLSVVIEWENVGLAGFARTREMLEELRRQAEGFSKAVPAVVAPRAAHAHALALATPVELIIAYDPGQTSGDALRRSLDEVIGSAEVFHLLFAEAPGERYYGLKNRGAALATGDVVLFLDSDVIPQPSWLVHLLTPFADPAVDGVAGISVIEPDGALGRAMALCGVFPLPPEEIVVERRRHFFACSLALRRSLVAQRPFPVMEAGVARVACAHLAARLYDEGRVVYVHTGARVRHPAPNGARHFVVRALAHGRDDLYLPGREPATLLTDLRRGLERTEYYLRQVWRERHRAGLSPLTLPLVLGIAVAFHTTRTVGHVLTHVFPRFMHTRFLRV